MAASEAAVRFNLRSHSSSDAYVLIPAKDHTFKAGDVVEMSQTKLMAPFVSAHACIQRIAETCI